MIRILAIVLLLGGCGAPRPVPVDVAAWRQRCAAADVVVASLLVQTLPTAGDGETFSLRLWATADGAVRLRAQKLDVDFLEALVRGDGSYEAWLPRERVATSGRLGGPGDPPLLRDLRGLLDELRQGPVPAGVAVAPDGSWPDASGATATLAVGGDGLPTAKRLVRDGAVVRELTYATWKDFDGLLRPVSVRLREAGVDGTTAIRLKTLDTPPVISPERMQLRVPDGIERVEPQEFSRRLPGPPPG